MFKRICQYVQPASQLQTCGVVWVNFIDGNFNAQRYRDEILRTIVVSLICCHHLMFQQDNGRQNVELIRSPTLRLTKTRRLEPQI